MRNRGQLVALDVSEPRLEELRRRARRAGAHNLRALAVPAEGPLPAAIEPLVGRTERVLCDAPCSGVGALRRNPDARFRLDEGRLARFPPLQLEILRRMSLLVAPGGHLVYATCTVVREENEDVVSAFLAGNGEFVLRPPALGLGARLAEALGAKEFLKTAPDRHGADGFFAALLRRRAE
jgi:16S rRNA (cytosine967-C5)-methyltransferase